MLDMAWHEVPAAKLPKPEDVMTMEQAILTRLKVAYPPVPPRYHTTYFNHIFAGGYEAGYYAYMWSEVLARDSGAWFTAHGGLKRENGDTFRGKLLSVGGSVDPMAAFRAVRGRDADPGPLLRRRGLVAAGS